MFGLNKKKVLENEELPLEDKGMDDDIQFDFEEDDKLPFDDASPSKETFGSDEDDEYEEFEEVGLRQKLQEKSKVILLGVLLLLGLGVGGYYFLSGPPEPPPAPPAPVKAKVKVTPAGNSPVQVAKPAAPAPATTATAPETTATAPAAKAASPAVAPTPVVAPPAPASKSAVTATAPTAKSEIKSKGVGAATGSQPFTLSAGAFLSQKHATDVEKKIRRQGYTPKVETIHSMVPMTRLLIGVYEPATAEARRKELITQIPDLFTMKKEDKIALYAGSYQSLDLARTYADQLFLSGIHVDEESVSLSMPLTKVTYGSFPTSTAAEKAAKRAVTAGLPAEVVKR